MTEFVSLGDACAVASSMEKYGLRSFAGPFDWIVTYSFESVIAFLETDFEDFLNMNNLVVEKNADEYRFATDAPIFVRDEKNNILYTYEVEENFEKEYPQIKAKYVRRIERLIKSLNNGSVVFLRRITNHDEITFICCNSDRIKKAIMRKNPSNRVIFLIPYFMNIPDSFPFQYFILQYDYLTSFRTGLRMLFDSNSDFINFCISEIDPKTRERNLSFSQQKEERAAEYKVLPVEYIEGRAIRLLNQAYKTIHRLEREKRELIQSKPIAQENKAKWRHISNNRFQFEICHLGVGNGDRLVFNKKWDYCGDRLESFYNGILSLRMAYILNAKLSVLSETDYDRVSDNCRYSLKPDVICSTIEEHSIVINEQENFAFEDIFWGMDAFGWDEEYIREITDTLDFYFEMKNLPRAIDVNLVGIYIEQDLSGDFISLLKQYVNPEIDQLYIYDSKGNFTQYVKESRLYKYKNIGSLCSFQVLDALLTCGRVIGTASPLLHLLYSINKISKLDICVIPVIPEKPRVCFNIPESNEYIQFISIKEKNRQQAFNLFMKKLSSAMADGLVIETRLKRMNIHSVAIYGWGTIGKLLYSNLRNSCEVDVKYVVDKTEENKEGIVELIRPGEVINRIEVDAMIITPLFYGEEIYRELRQEGFTKDILWLEWILYDTNE